MQKSNSTQIKTTTSTRVHYFMSAHADLKMHVLARVHTFGVCLQGKKSLKLWRDYSKCSEKDRGTKLKDESS